MELRSDFLIIGSGIAALRAVPEVAGHGDVLILTKGGPGDGNTGHAQGGIAAAVGPGDTPELHSADTIAAGDGLCDPHAVQVLVEDGPRFVRELISWGVQFDRAANGELALAMEAAHSARRVLHARDATGREIGRVLWERASQLPLVKTHDHARVVDLVIDSGRCIGARFLTGDGEVVTALAPTVLLATGGAGQVYQETTNPQVATGDGVAMAYRAGAAVVDLEFVQFHPTALMVEGQPRFLLSEALRGEGAQLVNTAGEAFMSRYEAAGDLAPRDRVSRAIVRESRRTKQPVYLSLERLNPEFVHKRFPLISEMCRRAGLDLARDRIPVGPAAHYVMGGVQTDLDGRTTIPGLFAAGEVACTGVHGANRLASNSLLEGLVFGARAGCAMREEKTTGIDLSSKSRLTSSAAAAGRLALDPDELTRIMWRDVGLFRDRDGLTRALAVLEPAWEELDGRLSNGGMLNPNDWRTASIATVGRLIARAALRREESRGGHYRADFPDRDDVHWKRRVSETKTVRGQARPGRVGAAGEAPRINKKMAEQTAAKGKEKEKTDALVTEITPQSEDFSRWYLDVVRRAELADYTPVKGCMAIRPYGYAIWELIQQGLDRRFKETGHVNAYFPLFIPESLLMREAEHVEGFAPQVAWVTRGGEEDLEERLIVRPTSEVIIGTMYSKWIKSWRDLPVLINQWANVVRWEKVTRPFLRTTEFLWQEGHTAHETQEEAQDETMRILALYKDFVEKDLAMPVIDGQKSDSEKFAGASKTYSIEALMGDGRALQAGTSHNLGQNFAKAFEIQFQGRDKNLQYAWTTSWGVSTRLIGGVIMTHGDDSGLILPPRVAPYQVVIVPIARGNWQETVLPRARDIQSELRRHGVRVMLDDRDAYTPGWKFAEWEMRGVPVRLEIGPKDIEKSQVLLARRDTREKLPTPMEGLAAFIVSLLETIQNNLFERAVKFREEHTQRVSTYDEFKSVMEGRPGFVIAPWCGSAECEAQIKAETQATLRNIPLAGGAASGGCVKCGRPAEAVAWFAKAY